ncbi:hypothetical protein [Qipengyuania sp. JC766]|uniref:hypothetical protein n=1 Tax=Qipengyuania sp. JC766 TaxID=3232139 RepID=UPI00345AE225
MSGFLFAFVAVFVTSFGGRDQLLVAELTGRLGSTIGLAVTACLTVILATVAMTLAGDTVASLLPVSARSMLVAIALIFVAIELFWPMKPLALAEPTRSLAAIGIVLFARQIGDAARFCVFALAAAYAGNWAVGAGGVMGGVTVMILAWTTGADLFARLPVLTLRRVVGAIVLCVAIVIGLSARGLLG